MFHRPLAHAAVEDEVESRVEDEQEVVEVAEAQPGGRQAQTRQSGQGKLGIITIVL